MLKRHDVAMFTAHLSITIKRLTGYKQKVVLATMLEGKSMSSNIEANTNHTTLLNNQCHKISPLNTFPLKFRV